MIQGVYAENLLMMAVHQSWNLADGYRSWLCLFRSVPRDKFGLNTSSVPHEKGGDEDEQFHKSHTAECGVRLPVK